MPNAMLDAAEREVAIDPSLSVLVQAPAGSGKTTLLTQRLLALLQRVSGPERILALTFTRKAAAEMRARVLNALEQAQFTACPAGFNAKTWQLARAARTHMLEQGIDLQRHPTRLRIETIDSFCAWLAAQLPVTAGAGGRIEVTEDAMRFYEEAAAESLTAEGQDPFHASVDRVLELNDERWWIARDRIAGMLNSRSSWLSLLAGRLQAAALPDADRDRETRRVMDEDLALLIERHLERAAIALGGERLQALEPLLRAAAQRLQSDSQTLRNWRDAGEPLAPVAAHAVRWREMAEVLLTGKGEPRVGINKTQGFLSGQPDTRRIKEIIEEIGRYPEMLEALAGLKALPAPAYDDSHWERVGALARTLVLAAAQLNQVFRRRGAGDFSAVFLAAMQALGTSDEPTDLALLLDHRIEHILVDEFQDTSNAQLDLFKLLTAGWQDGDGRTFFCVGDPMQSIYGFREAEVRAFLELAQDGLGDIRLRAVRLSSNYRAQPPLVDWTNRAFERIFPRSDDRHRGAIAFSAAQACAQPEAGPAGVSLHLYESAQAEAAGIAQALSERLGQHPRWRAAILVRYKRQALAIAEALRARQLPFRALDIGRLQDEPVVRDIVMLSRALLHLEDRVAWLAILRAPFVGLGLDDLWLLRRHPHTLWQSLHDADCLARLSPPGAERARRCAATIDQAFAARDQSGFARWVERTWMALGGASTGLTATDVGCARAAFVRLEELDQQDLIDGGEFERAFANLFPADEGEQPIEIMTIHKSKGLEFELVAVPSLQGRPVNSGGEFLRSYSFSRTDRPGFVLAAAAEIGQDDDELLAFLRACDKDADRLEAQRLLYVACTRAKQELYLTAVDEKRAGVAGDFNPPSGSLLKVLWPGTGTSFQFIEQPLPEAVQASTRVLRRLPAAWRAPPLAVSDGLPVPAPRAEASPPFDWAGETARQIGILVHACLQDLRCDDRSAARVHAQREAYEAWFAARGVPAGQIDTAVARVTEALLAVLEDEKGQWILAQYPAHDARELALSANLGGRVTNIVLDRTFVHEGERWVIDYKTSHHGGGQLEAFLQSELERYGDQLRRYARIAARLGPEPVRVGLYFPLMRAFREWRG